MSKLPGQAASEGNMLDIARIEPAIHPRYSANLYKWLTKPGAGHRVWTSRVYVDQDKSFWIGHVDDGWFSGCRMMAVLCMGAKEDTGAYRYSSKFVEIPDFWTKYMAIGRCAIDAEHDQFFTDDETRWQTNGDVRNCQWCGSMTQKLRRWEEVVHREAWEKAEA